MRTTFGVYVIVDNGSGEESLPFFAQTSVIAQRQFCQQLRVLPPSCRGDFSLVAVAVYCPNADPNQRFQNDNDVTICTGADEEISKMIEQDESFYHPRTHIDNLPVTESSNV